jgi:hypothetical protein
LSVTAITIIDLSLEGSPNFAVTEFYEVRFKGGSTPVSPILLAGPWL